MGVLMERSFLITEMTVHVTFPTKPQKKAFKQVHKERDTVGNSKYIASCAVIWIAMESHFFVFTCNRMKYLNLTFKNI